MTFVNLHVVKSGVVQMNKTKYIITSLCSIYGAAEFSILIGDEFLKFLGENFFVSSFKMIMFIFLLNICMDCVGIESPMPSNEDE